jgi:hypothetical protein
MAHVIITSIAPVNKPFYVTCDDDIWENSSETGPRKGEVCTVVGIAIIEGRTYYILEEYLPLTTHETDKIEVKEGTMYHALSFTTSQFAREIEDIPGVKLPER